MCILAIVRRITYVISLENSGNEGWDDTNTPTKHEARHAQDSELDQRLAVHRPGHGGRTRHAVTERACNDLEALDLSRLFAGGFDSYGMLLAGWAVGAGCRLLIDGDYGRAGHGAIRWVASVHRDPAPRFLLSWRPCLHELCRKTASE